MQRCLRWMNAGLIRSDRYGRQIQSGQAKGCEPENMERHGFATGTAEFSILS